MTIRDRHDLHRRAKLFEVCVWGFAITLVAATVGAVWLGAPFFQALRTAQIEFGDVMATQDAGAYPAFVRRVIAEWPQRLAAFPRDAQLLAAILAFFGLGLAAFNLPRRKPRGEAIRTANPRQEERLRDARALSGYDGLLLRRVDQPDIAAATPRAVYLPAVCVQWLNRPAIGDAARRLAFVIRHELCHVRSLDNLLWSLGLVGPVIVTGLFAALLGQFVVNLVLMALPEWLFQSIPGEVTAALVAVTSLLVLGLFAAAVTGSFAGFAAGREYFADARAGEALGLAEPPYAGASEIRGVGSILDPWRSDCAAADRSLHLRGVFPRWSAVMACSLAVWSLVRVGLAFALSFRLGWAVTLFDAAALVFIAGMALSLPRPARGVRAYGVLPWGLFFAELAALGGIMPAIDGFALQHGVPALFGASAPVWTVAPPLLAALGIWIFRRVAGQTPVVSNPVDAAPPRVAPRAALLYIAGLPSWSVSFLLSSFALFIGANGIADSLTSPLGAGGHALHWLAAAAGLLLMILLAMNLRSPTRLGIALEAIPMTLLLVSGMWVWTAAVQPLPEAVPFWPPLAAGLVYLASWRARIAFSKWRRATD